MSRNRRSAVPADPNTYRPGFLLASFEVNGRAVPWKPARIRKDGTHYKVPSLASWQTIVRLAAAAAMRPTGRAPYAKTVGIELLFILAPKPGRPPDTTNLVKAFEDALEGTVIVNDTQVVATGARRFIDRGQPERVQVSVYAERPGSPETVPGKGGA